jgi:hypothetical protein
MLNDIRFSSMCCDLEDVHALIFLSLWLNTSSSMSPFQPPKNRVRLKSISFMFMLKLKLLNNPIKFCMEFPIDDKLAKANVLLGLLDGVLPMLKVSNVDAPKVATSMGTAKFFEEADEGGGGVVDEAVVVATTGGGTVEVVVGGGGVVPVLVEVVVGGGGVVLVEVVVGGGAVVLVVVVVGGGAVVLVVAVVGGGAAVVAVVVVGGGSPEAATNSGSSKMTSNQIKKEGRFAGKAQFGACNAIVSILGNQTSNDQRMTFRKTMTINE